MDRNTYDTVSITEMLRLISSDFFIAADYGYTGEQNIHREKLPCTQYTMELASNGPTA